MCLVFQPDIMEGTNKVSDCKQASWTLFIEVDACTQSGHNGIYEYGNIVEQNVMETRTLKLTMQRVKLFIIHSELRMVAP